MYRQFAAICVLTFVGSSIAINATWALDKGYQELRGPWQVIELVDNGRVIPAQQIPSWLPSGGNLEIVDNSIVFTSTKDGTRHARTFEIDATTFPKTMNLVAGSVVYGQGIYEFRGGNLVVCVSPPAEAPRPTEFSAPSGSKRVLMVMQRDNMDNPSPSGIAPSSSGNLVVQAARPPAVANVQPSGQTVTTIQQVEPSQTVTTTTVSSLNLPPPPDVRLTSAVDGQARTSAEIVAMLPGTWKINDAYGALYLELTDNGKYSSFRESVSTSTFQKVFARLPVSGGTWSYSDGRIVFHCTSTSQPERLNKDHPFQVKSITPLQMVFIDYVGNIGQATRVQ